MRKITLFFCVFFLLVSWGRGIAGISIVNGLAHIFVVQGEASYSGVIEIQNMNNELVEVELSVQDFFNDDQGRILYGDSAHHNRTARDWISLQQTSISIGPNARYVVPYEVNVPPGVELDGSYWAVVMVEPVTYSNLEQKEDAVGIITQVRYAIQIVCNSESAGKVEVQFKNVQIKKKADQKYLDVTLENTGDVFQKVYLVSQLYNAETGEDAGVFSSAPQSLFPYASRKFSIDITDLQKQKYKGIMQARCSDDEVFGLNFSLNIDE